MLFLSELQIYFDLVQNHEFRAEFAEEEVVQQVSKSLKKEVRDIHDIPGWSSKMGEDCCQ